MASVVPSIKIACLQSVNIFSNIIALMWQISLFTSELVTALVRQHSFGPCFSRLSVLSYHMYWFLHWTVEVEAYLSFDVAVLFPVCSWHAFFFSFCIPVLLCVPDTNWKPVCAVPRMSFLKWMHWTIVLGKSFTTVFAQGDALVAYHQTIGS